MANDGKNNNKPLFKPKDLVRTPRGRTAVVVAILPDGARELQYTDQDKGTVAMRTCHLTLIEDATPQRWPSRLPPT